MPRPQASTFLQPAAPPAIAPAAGKFSIFRDENEPLVPDSRNDDEENLPPPQLAQRSLGHQLGMGQAQSAGMGPAQCAPAELFPPSAGPSSRLGAGRGVLGARAVLQERAFAVADDEDR